jgi:predicted metal-dependent hydrolase
VGFDQFYDGINHFNRGCFFEAHDTLEDLWMGTRGTDRLFLQGLIQVSVGFYHLFNRNYAGASSQLTKGLGKLERYRPAHQNVDLETFTQQTVAWLALAERGARGENPDLDESQIPKLQFIRP